MPGKAFFLGLLGCAAALAVWTNDLASVSSDGARFQAVPLQLDLSSGHFDALCYECPGQPRGIIVLASSDGGWSCWEERTARHLAEAGYIVGAWDSRKFADTRRYDQKSLAEGWRMLTQALMVRCRAEATTPVWYGGWSAGAEQAVAAAAAQASPLPLTGLLLAAPGARGRYGITDSDLLGHPPSGRDSFALADLAPDILGVPVAQFAAEQDPQDDTVWLDRLGTSPHRLYSLPAMSHDLDRAGSQFQAALDSAIVWTRLAAAPRKTAPQHRGFSSPPRAAGKERRPGT